LWGKTTPKIDTVHLAQHAIGLFHEPAQLVDANLMKLLHANSPFLVLTAFSLAEITSAPPAELFEGLDQGALVSGEEVQLMLRLRNRPAMPVVLRNHLVEPVNQWVVMKVTPLSKYQQSRRSGRNDPGYDQIAAEMIDHRTRPPP